MAGRPRSGGRRGRGRHGLGSQLLRWVLFGALLRTAPGRVAAGVHAARRHPYWVAAVVVFWTIAYQANSITVAAVATPLFWVAGVVGWFELRRRRTGVTVQEVAAEIKRERRVRKQWDYACEAAGLRTTPNLYGRSVRSEGDTVVVRFNAAGCGIDRDTVLSGLGAMHRVIAGGCRSASMKALGNSGHVEVRFSFADVDPLAKVITPNMLGAAPKGCVPYGLSESGEPVYFRLLNDAGECVFTPLMVVGASRSGKSSSIWAQLLGFIAAGVPVELYAADPKGGMELTALEDALNRKAGTALFRVVEYADDPEGDGKKIMSMVQRLEKRMNARMLANKGRRKRAHVPTVAEPFLLLLVDELLLLTDLLKAGKAGPLGRIQLAGAAAGCSVIGCTQLSRAADLNPQIRDLFLRRMVFRVPSREAVETALGSGNGWSEKAPAHKIRDRAEEKGIGYAVDTEGDTSSSTEAVRFRSVWIDDDAIDYIAEGEMPPGTDRFAREQEDPAACGHAVYRFYDDAMALLYVGETNNLDRRWAEHARSQPWWDEVVQDSEHMVPTWYRAATARDAERLAKAAESHAIRTEKPRYNRAENQRNPLRVIRGGRGGRAA